MIEAKFPARSVPLLRRRLCAALIAVIAVPYSASCSSPSGGDTDDADVSDTGGRPIFPAEDAATEDGSGDGSDADDATSDSADRDTADVAPADAASDSVEDASPEDAPTDTEDTADVAADIVPDAASDSAPDTAPDSAADVSPDVTPDVAPDVEVDTGPDAPTYTWLDPLLDVPPQSNPPCTRPGSMSECRGGEPSICRHFAVEESRCESCSPCGNLNALCSSSSECDILFTCFMGRCTAACSFETPQTCGNPADCAHVGHPAYGVCLPF